MKKASIVLMGLSVSSGISAGVLAALNLLIWATLTFWLGSLLAFVGFVLVLWALLPKNESDESDQVEDGYDYVNAVLGPIAAPA